MQCFGGGAWCVHQITQYIYGMPAHLNDVAAVWMMLRWVHWVADDKRRARTLAPKLVASRCRTSLWNSANHEDCVTCRNRGMHSQQCADHKVQKAHSPCQVLESSSDSTSVCSLHMMLVSAGMKVGYDGLHLQNPFWAQPAGSAGDHHIMLVGSMCVHCVE